MTSNCAWVRSLAKPSSTLFPPPSGHEYATRSEIKNQGIDVLIGRHHLVDEALIYNGPLRLYTLCY
ncbi:MAG: hypothetical protein WAK11_07220 [Candidatus Cybelea sp.]